MNNNLFNTVPEISARLLVVLSLNEMTLQHAECLDFMTIYAHDFDNRLNSLHPNNYNRSADLPALSPIYNKSINYLCLKGLVSILSTRNGIIYKVCDIADKYINLFDGEYINTYKFNLRILYDKYNVSSDLELYKTIVDTMNQKR